MSLLGWLRSRWPFGGGESAGGPETAPEEASNVPGGYQVAAVDIAEFNDPRAFDPPVPDIACLACGEAYSNYWEWFNHGKDVHEFASIEEAREISAVIVPSGHDGELDTGEGITGNVAESTGKPSLDERFANDER